VLQVGSLSYSSSVPYPKSRAITQEYSLKNKCIKYIINFPFLPLLKIDPSNFYFSLCILADGAFTCSDDSHRVYLWNSYNPNLFQNSFEEGRLDCKVNSLMLSEC